ncbi:hypothetical protein ACFW1M_40145 [Streptomyces inhibens]
MSSGCDSCYALAPTTWWKARGAAK